MPKSPFNVLLTSGGRRVALLRHFQQALKSLGISGQVFVADASPHSAAFHAADKGLVVPRVTHPSYLSTLQSLCKDHSIRLVVPLIDTELSVLAKARETFSAQGTTLLVSAPEVIETTRDKHKTFTHFSAHKIPTPRVLSLKKALEGETAYPVFLKPMDGSRSIGSHLIRNLEELRFWSTRTENPILLEYIEGKEYTVDIFVTKAGKAAIAVPRWRQEVREGEISKGVTVKDPAIIEGALTVARSFKAARGVLTAQCRVNQAGVPVFFEVNARFGGGAPLSIQAGAHFPKWILMEELGKEVPPSEFRFEEGLRMYRYDDAIWVKE